ncbi:MAG: hypothetical protein KF845_04320 [Cyclobacteriaceae bacterium]|nr:hypothetical protein [Cyclobacteriaceae bacterium]
MKISSSFLLVFLLLSSVSIARQSMYDGQAVWLPADGATEKFRFISTDSAKVLQGEYLWRLNHKNNETGWFELAHIKVMFRNNLPEGEIELLDYTVNFDVDDFDLTGVQPVVKGNRTFIRGRYSKGRPVGEWRFEYGPFDDSEKREVLLFNTATNTWSFRGDSVSFNGKTNPAGIFDGRWNFNYSGRGRQDVTYQNGILTGMQVNGTEQVEKFFLSVKQQIKLADSIVAGHTTNPWIWMSGFAESDSLYQLQTPVGESLNKAMAPYRIGERLIGAHPLLDLPLIKGVSALYFALKNNEAATLMACTKKLTQADSVLKSKLEQPVFQLRRSGTPGIDSLLRVTEGLIADIERQKNRIEKFLSKEARYTSPEYLLAERNVQFKSPSDFVYYLEKTSGLLETQVNAHINDLRTAVEYLRLKGDVEKMEEEWVFLRNDISNHIPTDDKNRFAIAVYNRFVEADFNEKKGIFAGLDSYESRRAFLTEVIAYYEFFREFYIHTAYLGLTDVQEEFTRQYTKYLYNPYMGVNNVEVVVKKKFLHHVLNQFWPYLLNELEQADNGNRFRELYAQVLEYKGALLFLADDNKQEAKRFERRGRKETNMQAVEALMIEYTEHWKNSVE